MIHGDAFLAYFNKMWDISPRGQQRRWPIGVAWMSTPSRMHWRPMRGPGLLPQI
jgi:hypothetical protein